LSIKTAYTSISNLFYLNTDSYFSNPTGTNPRLSINGVSFSNQQLESSVNQGRYEIGFILNEWRDKVKEQSKLDASKVSDEYIIESINDVLGDLNTIRNYFDDMATLFALYNIEISDTGDINSAKSSASSARSSVDSSISSFTSSLQSYNNSITSLDQALENLRLKQEPADEATIATAKSSLENAKSNLTNAETTYASRIITAPFDGQIGGLNAEVGQQVSSSDSLGTLITSEKVINVTLNEVDAAKVSANNPVTITFDSLPGVTVSGYVAYIDPLGTVSQGVVSYSLQIKMNEQNEQIKTGMTATVSITTKQSLNTLTIPTSAITTMGTKKFVLVSNSSISTSTIK
jgi:RND family efflux transporter MFP subunit